MSNGGGPASEVSGGEVTANGASRRRVGGSVCENGSEVAA